MNSSAFPRVTVVTPVFNGERFIEETLVSVRGQTYPNIEHIIVDGGSTDGTLNIVRRFEDSIAKVITEPDQGMYDALNKGFSYASGSVYCYLNSDDCFEPYAVEKAVDAMRNQNSEFCVGNCIYTDEFGSELFRYDGVPFDFGRACELGRMPFAQQTAFWSRELHLAVGGFDPRLMYVADTKFFYELLRAYGRAPILNDAYIARFRQHSQAFSSKARKDMTIEHNLMLESIPARSTLMRCVREIQVKWINRGNLTRKLLRKFR